MCKTGIVFPMQLSPFHVARKMWFTSEQEISFQFTLSSCLSCDMVKSNDFPEYAFSHGNQYTARDLPFMLDCQILNKSPFQYRAKKELLGYWQTF